MRHYLVHVQHLPRLGALPRTARRWTDINFVDIGLGQPRPAELRGGRVASPA